MDLIHIDLENIRAQAKTVRTKANDYHDVLNKVSNLCASLNEVWSGAGQIEFNAKFLAMHGKLNEFSNILDAFADAMEDTVKRFETADAQITKKIKQG